MYYGDKLCSCRRVTHAVSSRFLRIIYNFASQALTQFTPAKSTVQFMCFSVIVFKIERLKVKSGISELEVLRSRMKARLGRHAT